MTQEDGTVSTSRSPRFTTWAAFLIFSTITLGAAVEAKNYTEASDGTSDANQKWAIACSGITFGISLIVVLMHMHSVTSIFIVGTKIEGFLCLILAVFWAATVSIVSDARHGLAVNENGEVKNGNLYYFSWAGFVCSIVLWVSYLRSAFQFDVAGTLQSRSSRLQLWAGFLAASLIVMGASANIFGQDCTNGNELTAGETYCRRTKFSISIGVIGTVFALIVVILKIVTSRAPFMLESFFSVSLMFLFAFGVAYTTSQKGPGAPLGNLYYFTWISFLCTFMLTASIFEDYQTAKSGGSTREQDDDQDTRGDIQVESLDDAI